MFDEAPRLRRPPCRVAARVGSGAMLIVACAAWLSCSVQPAPRNLIVIVVDTLRVDRVGVYGADRDTTPALDAFARDAVRFERAYSSAPWTQPAVASMFTGLHPSGHGLVHLGGRIPPRLVTLPEVLASQGFATGAVVSHVLVGRRYGFARGFGQFDQEEAGGHATISTPGVTERALAMLDELARDDRRFFLFVHYFDPHYSYQHHAGVGFAPARTGRVRGGEAIEFLWRLEKQITPPELAHLRALYDEEIRFTDDGLGRLLERLADTGRLDDSVVVVTADHGEEFLERTRIGHAASVYEELVRVPLVVRTPEARGRLVASPVSTAALAPTLLDLLEVAAPELRPATRSFGPLVRGEGVSGDVHVLSETRWFAQKKALVGPRFKLIRDEISGRRELYDLEADPGERDDRAAALPEVVGELEARLDEALERQRELASPSPPVPIEAEQRALLRSLGYLDAPGLDAPGLDAPGLEAPGGGATPAAP